MAWRRVAGVLGAEARSARFAFHVARKGAMPGMEVTKRGISPRHVRGGVARQRGSTAWLESLWS